MIRSSPGRRLTALAVAGLLAFVPPVAAQAPDGSADPRGRMAEGIELLGEGMRLLFEGMQEEATPLMQELLDQATPALGAARDGVGRLLEGLDAIGIGLADLAGYHAPVLLPNGDILIRRRLPPDHEPQDAEDDAVGPTEL